MFYLAKFCRICIQTGVKLLDIETVDFDSVKLSEKLELCTEMVITRESLSTEICQQCVNKLRVSYDFQKMCKQSSVILQEYLTELISASSKKITPETFVNSDLRVTLTSISKSKRKRISKEQRCSLLKRLLQSKNGSVKTVKNRSESAGGLRNIFNFTRNYDFGYSFKHENPLNQLAKFTNNFFKTSFTDFHDTILYLIESKDDFDGDSDEEMFESVPDIKCEQVIIEPDIKSELEEYENYASNYVETTYVQENQNCYPECNSVNMLDKLVETLSGGKSFSPFAVRCRTRGNPYINPQLKRQFQLRNFRCEQCNRYFKGPGYLKAHVSKMHYLTRKM